MLIGTLPHRFGAEPTKGSIKRMKSIGYCLKSQFDYDLETRDLDYLQDKQIYD